MNPLEELLNKISTDSFGNGEVKYFLREISDEDMRIECLVWWMKNSEQFSRIVMFSRDLFAAPISSVASESQFSSFGNLNTDQRTMLSDITNSAIMFWSSWKCVLKVWAYLLLSFGERFSFLLLSGYVMSYLANLWCLLAVQNFWAELWILPILDRRPNIYWS